MSGSVGALGSAQINSEISTVEARLQQPITLLDSQATTDKADISAWGSIKGGMSSLQSALAGISTVASLADRAATSSTSSVATATATNTAQAGTYNLTNVTLAKAQEIYSSVQKSASASLGSGAGSLTFTQNGKTETVSVGSGSMTLNGIASAINKVAGGVAASVVNTSGGARLVLQGSATGSSQAFSVSGTGALAQFEYSPSSGGTSMTSAQAAANATLDINGVPISNATNSLSSAVSGLTIKLAGSGTSVVTVSSAPTGLTTALSSVATSLNSAISNIATQIKFVPATTSASASGSTAAKSGPLLGNFSATDLSNQLLTAVSGAAASGMTSNSIGLTVSSAGAVSFSSSTFAAAYASNPTGVQNLVTQIYKSLSGVTTGALGSANSTSGGTIGAQTSSLQSEVSSITSQVTQITKQNDDQLQILVNEYSTAEAASTSAQVTQAYLSIFDSTTSSSSAS